MTRIHKRQNINPSCPKGGKFYACESGTNFVGCCNAEPCQRGCSDGNLVLTSFNPAAYGTFPDQQCPQGSRWYTCAYTEPPFMGCCKSNPCGKGCPEGDLTAGFLDSNPRVAAPFLSSNNATSTASEPSSTSASSTEPPPAKGGAGPGAIAGGVVGGVAFLAFLILLAVFLFFRRRKALTAPELDGREATVSTNPNKSAHDVFEAPGDGVVATGLDKSGHAGNDLARQW